MGTVSLDEEPWWLRTFIECETRTRGSEGYTPSELETRTTGRAAGCHGTAHRKRDADDGGRCIAYTHCNETRTKGGDGSHSTRPSNARREQWVEVVAVTAHAYRTRDANDRQRGTQHPSSAGRKRRMKVVVTTGQPHDRETREDVVAGTSIERKMQTTGGGGAQRSTPNRMRDTNDRWWVAQNRAHPSNARRERQALAASASYGNKEDRPPTSTLIAR